jgi:hypothetical protein
METDEDDDLTFGFTFLFVSAGCSGPIKAVKHLSTKSGTSYSLRSRERY